MLGRDAIETGHDPNEQIDLFAFLDLQRSLHFLDQVGCLQEDGGAGFDTGLAKLSGLSRGHRRSGRSRRPLSVLYEA